MKTIKTFSMIMILFAAFAALSLPAYACGGAPAGGEAAGSVE